MKTVLCHGVFDLLHAGHIEHFRQAKYFGDWLVVSVIADEFVNKPRPLVYSQQERMTLLSAVRYVDEVVLCNAHGPEKVIENLKPDIYVRGDEYSGKRMPEQELLEKIGISVRYTNPCPPHTSEIIEKIWSWKPSK